MSESVVLYEEKGSVAIVTLNRPDKMNTLTEGVVQGVADAIDRATASRPVRSIVLRAVIQRLRLDPAGLSTSGSSAITAATRSKKRLRTTSREAGEECPYPPVR